MDAVIVPQGWGKTTTIKVLADIVKFRDDSRAAYGKTYPTAVTKDELDYLKRGNPSMADWYDRNTILIQTMSDEPTLLERLGGKRETEQDRPALNRADRRNLRNRKTR